MDSLHEANSESVPKDVEYGHDASRDVRVSVDSGAYAVEVVEQIASKGGTWSDVGGTHTLIVDGPDVTGILRFMWRLKGWKNSEFFLVALGNYTDTWCDLKVNLRATDTGGIILQIYDNPGTPEYSVKKRHQKTVTGGSTSGTKITVTLSGQVLVVSLK